jgi:hypothetical protein
MLTIVSLMTLLRSFIIVVRMSVEVCKPGWVGEEDHPVFSVDVHPGGTKFATGQTRLDP